MIQKKPRADDFLREIRGASFLIFGAKSLYYHFLYWKQQPIFESVFSISVLLVMQVISCKTVVTNYMCNFPVCISTNHPNLTHAQAYTHTYIPPCTTRRTLIFSRRRFSDVVDRFLISLDNSSKASMFDCILVTFTNCE